MTRQLESHAPSPSRRGFLRAAVSLFAAGAARSAAREPGAALVYDVSRFKKTDPALRRCVEKTPVDPGLPGLAAVAVGPEGRRFVAAGRVVAALDDKGRPTWRTALEGPVRCLAAGPDGRLYAGLRDHVERLSPAGTPEQTWAQLDERALVTSVAVAGEAVLVADAGTRAVWRFDLQGRLRGRIDGKAAADDRGFLCPSPHLDVASRDPDTFWAVNPGMLRLEHYTLDGRRLTQWGRAAMEPGGFCGCCNPTDIALYPDGTFVTAEKGLARVKLHAPDGRFLGIVAGPEDFDEPTVGLDLAVDAQGRILVVDPKRTRLRVFERKP